MLHVSRLGKEHVSFSSIAKEYSKAKELKATHSDRLLIFTVL